MTYTFVALFVAISVIAPLPPIKSSGITAFASTGDDYVAGKVSTLLRLKWNGRASAEVNNNKPQIKKRYLTYKKTYIRAAGLDEYGRPHTVRAVLGPETLNNGYRVSVGKIKPVGWQTVKYPDIVEDMYVYNRCHLIGQAVSAGKYSKIVNSKLNLVTGTRYMNFDGMLPYENELLDLVQDMNILKPDKFLSDDRLAKLISKDSKASNRAIDFKIRLYDEKKKRLLLKMQ